MKKILTIIMLITMLLCVVACSGSTNAPTQTPSATTDVKTVTWEPGDEFDSACNYVYTISPADFAAEMVYDYILISDEEYSGEFTVQGEEYLEYLEIFLPNATVNVASDVDATYIEATSGENAFNMYGKATYLYACGVGFALNKGAEVDFVYIANNYSDVDSVEIYSATNLIIITPTKLTVAGGVSIDLTALTAVYLCGETNSVANLNYSEDNGEVLNDTAVYVALSDDDTHNGTVNIDASSSITSLSKIPEDVWLGSTNAYSASQELSSMAFDKIIGGALDAVVKAQG